MRTFYFPLILLLLLNIPLPLIGGELTRAEQDSVAACLPAAETAILRGFESENHVLKHAAIRMMRYLPERVAYDKVLALFQNFKIPVTTPGFYLLRDAALETLCSLNRERTLSLLVSQGDTAFQIIDPYTLFSKIGFEAIPAFDNLFLYSTYYERVPGNSVFRPLLLAQFYLKTKDPKYGALLRFHDYEADLAPEDFRFLYGYFLERKLPIRKLVYTIQDRGGVLPLHLVVGRSYTLDELLFQALLYRLGLSAVVYNNTQESESRGNVVDEEARRRFNIPAEQDAVFPDTSRLPFFPSFIMNDAVAHFYAGVPEENHLAAFKESLGRFPQPIRYRYVRIICASPQNDRRQELLQWLLDSEDPAMKRMAAAAFQGIKTSAALDSFIAMLEKEKDPVFRSSLIEIIGEGGDQKRVATLCRYLDPATDPLMRITAAGQVLRTWGRGR